MAAAVTRVTITYESPGQPYFTRFTVDPGDSGRRHTVGELLNSFCVQHRKKYGAASDLVREDAAIVASGEADIVYTNKLAGTKSSVIRTPTIEAGGLNVNPLFGFLLKQPMTKNLMRVFLLQRSLANYKDTTLEIWQAGKGVGAIDRVEPVAAVVDRFAAQLAR